MRSVSPSSPAEDRWIWRCTGSVPCKMGVLQVGATLSREPGHREDADTELVMLSGWRLSF